MTLLGLRARFEERESLACQGSTERRDRRLRIGKPRHLRIKKPMLVLLRRHVYNPSAFREMEKASPFRPRAQLRGAARVYAEF